MNTDDELPEEASTNTRRILLDRGLVDELALRRAQQESRETGRRVGDVLIAHGKISRPELNRALSEATGAGLAGIELKHVYVDPQMLSLVDGHIARRLRLLPLYRLGIKAFVAMVDPGDEDAQQELALLVGCSIVRPLLVDSEELDRALDRYYGPAVPPVAAVDAASFPAEPPAVPKAEVASTAAPALPPATAPAAPTAARAEFSTGILSLVDFLLDEALNLEAERLIVQPGPDSTAILAEVMGGYRLLESLPDPLSQELMTCLHGLSGAPAGRPAEGGGTFQRSLRSRGIVAVRTEWLATAFGDAWVLEVQSPRLEAASTGDGIQQMERDTLAALLAAGPGFLPVTGPPAAGLGSFCAWLFAHACPPEMRIYAIGGELAAENERFLPVPVPGGGLDDGGLGRTVRRALRHCPDVLYIPRVERRSELRQVVDCLPARTLIAVPLPGLDGVTAVHELVAAGLPAASLRFALAGVVELLPVARNCSSCLETYTVGPQEVVALGLADSGRRTGATFRRGRGCLRCGQSGSVGNIIVPGVVAVRRASAAPAAAAPSGPALSVDGWAAELSEAMRAALRRAAARRAVTGLCTVEHLLTALEGH
ncbi:MAG: hypothetical protein HYV63_13775 [Candidatus Schekmanbacteria bacterium]|nr:hypothetical protein [Candidatus Schekmanbacteria bacterium]